MNSSLIPSDGDSQRLVIDTADLMHELGRRLGASLTAGDVLVLSGPLGAGKTTLTRGIGEGLNVRGPVTSPTFVLARTHPNLADGPPLVHVDAYRLTRPVELDDLDIDFDRSVVVVEWGKNMVDGLVDSWLDLTIERPTGRVVAEAESTDAVLAGDADDAANEPRLVVLTAHGPRWVNRESV